VVKKLQRLYIQDEKIKNALKDNELLNEFFGKALLSALLT
jgi:hypothetical protein